MVARCLSKRRRHLLHRRRQVALDAGIGLVGGAPEEDHDNERIGATYERVYQGVLVHPVDLSQKPADPVALYAALGAGAGRKPDLERYVVPEGVPLDHAIEQPHAPHRHRLYIVAAPIEERPDEATALQSVGRGKGEAPVFNAGGQVRHGAFATRACRSPRR